MFERFTAGARAAVVTAQAEAGELNAPRIEPAHLLLGLLVTADVTLRHLLADVGLTAETVRSELARDTGVLGDEDAAALGAIGIDLDSVRARLEETFGEGVLDRGLGRNRRGPFAGHLPFDPAAKKSLQLALREALARRDHVIGCEHLLLGILRSDDDRACTLVESHVSRRALRDRLRDYPGRAA
ncbi:MULTISPECIES: Clp protease N-terminal domain-containing protein [Rhodococcus]|uniref:Clp protease N-terminal domain-containing protein n=1 Tax=Rhodococcus TaxID=1827 RepID=UPI000C9AD00F|nr:MULTISPECIES: Clp protease N-terminal domain-containing protein [Rhodococcus]MDV6293768.1 Clp protease N-terminal domain-containing protein [Rhodococcus aetherivorans]PND49262.1 Clp protease [Rhodococcus sp. ENV425]WKW97265.1 Clp protease N-terminal domain-containing protein [Rhodococcus aetherivorans]